MAAVDVAIIGGGVMGLLSARELASRGRRVVVLERGALVSEASWAGGGIVSPLYPWRYADPVSALAAPSQRAYLELAPALRRESGIDPELRTKGLLMCEVEDQAAAVTWARSQGAPLEVIDPGAAQRLEPHIRPPEGEVLWMPEVCSIRNPRLGQALIRSLESNPLVQLRPQQAVLGLTSRGGQIDALELRGGRLSADQYLLCGGAWSSELLAPLGMRLPIAPVKGQMLLFRTGGELLERVVLRGGRYLIPRGDGRILVGSTLEQSGFDKRVTETAHRSLYHSALQILPALAEQPLEAQWAGLRPGTPGGVPYIGSLPGYANLFINAGQFRNGLVLAPASCRLAAELLCGEKPHLDPAPYAVDAERGGELL